MTEKMDMLWRDPKEGQFQPAPTHKSIIIPGKRGRLLSLLYCAGGEGPKPTVLIFHGFPGNEQNLDIAQGLRRVGFNTMSFHYSGSWGSDGAYRFSHCLEDADTVLDYMISHGEELQIDPEQLFLFGHSLGGFVGANVLAKRQEIKAGVLMSPADLCNTYQITVRYPQTEPIMMAFLANGAQWLNEVTAEDMREDVKALQETCLFAVLAESLSRKKLLMITAELDQTTPFFMDQQPLLERLDQLGRGNHRHLQLKTDHGYEDKRMELTEKIAEYLLEHCRRE
ncbi:MAG: alpha/beta fold hydrolase [Lachnospiraceae bacterium]|nr:alpha/beta fold hydrolase [Lachnospiraceae bacterium]